MMNSPPKRVISVRTGISLLEVLVSVGILAVVLSIVLPAFRHVRESARSVVCKSNMRVIGQGVSNYASRYKGYLMPSVVDPRVTGHDPSSVWIVNSASLTIEQASAIRCPTADSLVRPLISTYALNTRVMGPANSVRRINDFNRPLSDVCLSVETHADDTRFPYDQVGLYLKFRRDFSGKELWYFDWETARHGRMSGSNYLYLDGHVSNKMPTPEEQGGYPLGSPPQ
jgi:prepilin-type processing-associated H-X9-DG protein